MPLEEKLLVIHKGMRCVLVAVAFAFIPDSIAQNASAYPDRPVRMIVPLASGGGMDIVARLFAQKLSDTLKQQVVVDNRAGAGGVIGTELGAKATPNGYTLLWVSSSHAVLPALYKNLPYDPISDFSPVSLLVAYPFVLVAHSSLAANSVRELIAAAKSRPGGLSFASSGSGSTAHLAGELLKSLAAIDLTHIPYKGSGPAITGLLAGEATIGFYSSSATLQHVKAGRLKALATTGAKRSSALPNLPTVAEGGVPDFESSTWGGILVPARTPSQVVALLHRELLRILEYPDTRARLTTVEAQAVGGTPTEFAALISAEIVKWRHIVMASGTRID